MNILIINTAFEIADYILVKNNDVYKYKTDSNAKHSETSLLYINKVLQEANLNINEIDVIAVNIGPGSFTGVRIGLALVKGILCSGKKINVIGYNSFEPLKCRLQKENGKILISTGKKDFYIATVENNKIINYNCCEIDNLESDNIVNFDFIYNESELINLVKNKIEINAFDSINDLMPLYLKLSQAEEELLKKENN